MSFRTRLGWFGGLALLCALCVGASSHQAQGKSQSPLQSQIAQLKQQLSLQKSELELLRRRQTLTRRSFELMRWEFELLRRQMRLRPKPQIKIAPSPSPGARIDTRSFRSGPSLGPVGAKIRIIAFSDFQCPFCSKVSATLKKLRAKYKDRVRIVFKNFPLSFHKQAHLAAQAAMAAHAQGKFWQYHDKIFENMRDLRRRRLLKLAKQLGLDMARFQKALDSGTYKAYVDKDIQAGRRVGVRGTPSFIINGRKLVGAQPLHRFVSMIEGLLAEKKKR